MSSWPLGLGGLTAAIAADASIGCGQGTSKIIMAQAYPHSRVVGFDSPAASIDGANAGAAPGRHKTFSGAAV